jgi:F-type H+-transporting ATPase subunit b
MNRARKITGSTFLGWGVTLFLAGVAVASEAGGHNGHGIDAAKIKDFIWRTVNFVVFAAILIKLVARPAKEFFAKRAQDIAQSITDLETRKDEMAQALAEAEARLAQVEAEGEKILQQYQAEGEVEKAKIIDKANQVAARIKDMAAMTIDQETKKAARDLKQEVVDLATQMAEDLLKEKVTPADQQGLVEEYLKKAVQTH